MADKRTADAPARPGIYVRGTETVDTIMKAALAVLIDEGAAAFTIRRIAAACDMKVGNVSYHFPRKEMLIQVLLDELVISYNMLLDTTVRQPSLESEERLRRLIVLCLDDISSKRTTHLFTELWALANQNAFVADRVRAFYQRVHQLIGGYVAEINPALSSQEVEMVALYISASMEGSTPFMGYRKPWAHQMKSFTAMAAVSLVHLAKTIRPGEIDALTNGCG